MAAARVSVPSLPTYTLNAAPAVPNDLEALSLTTRPNSHGLVSTPEAKLENSDTAGDRFCGFFSSELLSCLMTLNGT